MKENKDDAYRLTPWGCMYAVLEEYGYDPKKLTPKMGEHMVEDFMQMMVTAGIVAKKGEGGRAMNLGDWEKIEIVTEEGDTIAVITEDGDTPITCKDGYCVCVTPKAEDE